MENEKISIIMTTYNRAELIMQSINSILLQTYSNWELLVIDDGSTDDTAALVHSIGDNRIFYHYLPRCAAVGKLKNYGLENASGCFISFLDSDDLWSPNKLEIQWQYLRSNPDAGFCVTNGFNFKTPGQPLEFFYKRKEGSYKGHLLAMAISSQLAAFTQALMVRRSCLEQCGGYADEDDITMNDQKFILKLAHQFTGIIIYEPLVERRLHAGNYIHESWSKSYREGADLVKFYKNSQAITRQTANESLFLLYTRYGEKCLLKDAPLEAARQFLQAWIYRPWSIIPLKKISKTFLKIILKMPNHRAKAAHAVVLPPGRS